MKNVALGTTGLQVSNICLGTMQFGWTADEATSFAVMDAFVEAGGNFLDTADIYSNWVPGHVGGESEEIIGRWLKARGNRDRVVIATKARGKMWDGADGEGLSRSHLIRAVDDSLRRLQIETIDLYQCHFPDEDTPIDETLHAFDELIRAGKVRYIGASNYTATQLEDALRAARAHGLPHFVSLQPHYNLVHRREFEGALESFCARENVAVIPYSPLAGGFLTGKYRKGQPLPKSQRAGRMNGYMNERGYSVVDALDQIAADRSVSVGAVALAWLLARPAMTAPIIGANSVEQLSDLLPAGDLALTSAEIAQLDAASR
jgi:aryl-alcohol dehydrogenase-like predicted oxidoreductase